MKNSIKHTQLLINNIILLEDNPRDITDDDLKKLSDDIKADPNFLFQRPSLINLENGEYLCYAGTQRIKAQKLLGYKKAICFVEENVPFELQQKRMLKDNLHRGIWNTDKLFDLGFEILELEEIGFDFDVLNIDLDLFQEPTDLVGDLKDNPPTLKLVFRDSRQLNSFEKRIKGLLDKDLYPEHEGVSYSISQGEL